MVLPGVAFVNRLLEAPDGRLEIGEKRLRQEVRDEPIRHRFGILREGACGHQQRLVRRHSWKQEFLFQARRLVGDDARCLTDRREAGRQVRACHRLGAGSLHRRQRGDGVRAQLLHRLPDCREPLVRQTRCREQVRVRAPEITDSHKHCVTT